VKTHEPGCTAGSSWTFARGVEYHPCSCGAPDIPLDYPVLVERLRKSDDSPDKSGWTTEAANAIESLMAERDESDAVANRSLDREAERANENRNLREEMRTMHKSVVHDCCVMVQQVIVLADTIEKEIAPIVGDKPTVVDRIRAALVVDAVEP
jgi:hypothetical protein